MGGFMKNIIVKIDRLGELSKAVEKLASSRVLVGIPESTAGRTDDSGENNAALGYIHEFGAPAQNIPARPFLMPGIQDAQEQIATRLGAAARAALKGDSSEVQAELSSAGTLAASSAKHRITAGPFEPLKPETVANRLRNRGTKSVRPEERAYADLIARGESPQTAQEQAGVKPLIDTGQMRNAITYAVVGKKRP